MGITIRQAMADDYAEIGRIAVDAYTAAGLLAGIETDYDEHLRDAAGRARTGELLVAVDDDGGKVLGSVTVCPHGTEMAEISRPGELEFRMLSVDPAAAGQGVGRALVNACVDRARELGCHAVVLCTQAHIPGAAQYLYNRMGFVRIPERDWRPLPDIPLSAFALKL